MAHRRLVLLCALAIVLALLAAVLVLAWPAGATDPLTVRAGSTPPPGAAVTAADLAAGASAAFREAASSAWYLEAARQQQAAAQEAARKATEARTATRPAPAPNGPEPAPDGSSASQAIARWFGDVYDQAWKVTGCESGHDPGAVSAGGGNWGLFQINSVHRSDFAAVTGRPWSSVLDADANAQYARHLYDADGGWRRDWSCAWAAYS